MVTGSFKIQRLPVFNNHKNENSLNANMNFKTKLGISLLLAAVVNFSQSYIASMKIADPFSHRTLSKTEKVQLAKRLKPELVEGIDSIASLFNKQYGLNASIMVNYKGHKIFDKAYGSMRPGGKKPLHSTHSFQLASVSKQFTAMATLMLVDKGKLDLSDTVQRHISYFPYEDITVKQVMTHTAGLPNYMWAIEHHWDRERAPYNDEVLKMMDSLDLNLYFTPGTRFFYANSGYITLAHLVEKVSGKRYDQFLQERIFDPLNMQGSFVYSKCWDKQFPERLKGYKGNGYQSYRVEDNALNGPVGDKGIYATPSDLYKWDQALYKGELISDSLMKQAFKPTILKNSRKIQYGYGFRLEQHENKKVVYHNGLWHGFRSSLKRYVEDNISLAVLNNTDSRNKGLLVSRLEDYLHKNRKAGLIFNLVFNELDKAGDKAYKIPDQAYKFSSNQKHRLRKAVNYLRMMHMGCEADNLLKVYNQMKRQSGQEPLRVLK